METLTARPALPTPPRQFGGGLLRWFGREGPLVVFAGFAISLIFNWQIVQHPRSVVMGGLGDPLLQAWELAWNGKLFSAEHFWTANMFYPAEDNFAFTDSLLGYLPLSLFGAGQPDAVLRYNIAFISAFALAFIGCYVLTRQLGGTWQAAALAGIVFAWAPWRLSHNNHLNILSVGGIALAFFALARGHGYSFRFGARPELARPWWVVAGWLIAAWQVTIGFATGLPFIYLMGAIGLVIVVTCVRRRAALGRNVLIANGAGMVAFLAVTVLMVIPYLRVVDRYHFTRSLAELEIFSPPIAGMFTASSQTWLWEGTLFNDVASLPQLGAGEMLLFPGLTVMVLALVGLAVSAWPLRIRIGLAVAAVVVTILSLGTTFFGGEFTYLLLWEHLPGWNALRTPGRLVLWTILLLVLLAAGAVTKMSQKLADRPPGPRSRWLVLLLVVPALAALLESVPAQSHATVPPIPGDLRRVFNEDRDPVLILPLSQYNQVSELKYLLWSTEGFPLMVNGNSGNFPPQYQQIAQTSITFPDNYSISVLEKYGIRKVVMLKNTTESYRFAEAMTRDISGLRLTRTDMTDIVVFRLR